ncbi:hypothetical protein GP5015_16 [gamma proteobacterium HTCC5015]|nr:hypothetical protein GP5015_16 [gamma proteobacterium HTCC5015]
MIPQFYKNLATEDTENTESFNVTVGRAVNELAAKIITDF